MEATGWLEDIREIKRDLSEIRKTLLKVAVQDEKIAAMGLSAAIGYLVKSLGG